MSKISFAEDTHPALDLPEGRCLSESLDMTNSPVLFGCRTGICGTCLVEVIESSAPLPPPGEEEKELLEILAPDNPKARLACQLDLRADICVRYLGLGT